MIFGRESELGENFDDLFDGESERWLFDVAAGACFIFGSEHLEELLDKIFDFGMSAMSFSLFHEFWALVFDGLEPLRSEFFGAELPVVEEVGREQGEELAERLGIAVGDLFCVFVTGDG